MKSTFVGQVIFTFSYRLYGLVSHWLHNIFHTDVLDSQGQSQPSGYVSINQSRVSLAYMCMEMYSDSRTHTHIARKSAL